METYQDAVARGLYHDALRRWTAYFPPEQILLLQYEQCIADPAGQLARTYRFLGLEPFVHEGIEKRVNATAHTLDLEEDVRRRLVELYESDVACALQALPGPRSASVAQLHEHQRRIALSPGHLVFGGRRMAVTWLDRKLDVTSPVAAANRLGCPVWFPNPRK